MSYIEVMDFVARGLEDTGPNQPAGIQHIIDFLVEENVVAGVWVGFKGEFTDEMVAEWWCGQVLSILQGRDWFAVNSILNWGFDWLEKHDVACT